MNLENHWLLRFRGLPLLASVFAAVMMVLLLVRGTGDSNGDTSWLQLLLLGLVLVLLLGAALRLLVMLAGIDPDAVSIAQHLTSEPDQQRLVARWLRRARWARNVGGISGLVWWVMGTSAQGDVLLCGVAGIAVGSMVAQLHQVRRPVGPRTASLDARTVSDYIPPKWRRRMMAAVAVNAALAVGGTVLPDAGSARWWGLSALVTLGIAHVVQRRVAQRPRPALSSGLQHADDLARGLAIDRGLAQPATYFALALFAHGVRGLEPTLAGLAGVLSVAAWLYAFYLWWGNRRLGLDHLLDLDQSVGVLS